MVSIVQSKVLKARKSVVPPPPVFKQVAKTTALINVGDESETEEGDESDNGDTYGGDHEDKSDNGGNIDDLHEDDNNEEEGEDEVPIHEGMLQTQTEGVGKSTVF